MIIVILFIGLVLRLINLNQSFWLDEAISVKFASELGPLELIQKFSLGDFHPPLYYLTLHYWLKIFPVLEISTRFPSVIFGTATIYIVYLISRKLYENKTAQTAAILMATTPLHIYYSQEARMYAMAAFLASVSFYFFVSIIKKDNILNWTGFILATVLMLYTDYLPYLILPVYLTYILIFRKKISKSTLVAFFPAALIILTLISPWIFTFLKQLQSGIASKETFVLWQAVLGESTLKNIMLLFIKFSIGRISTDNNLIYITLTLALFAISTLVALLAILRITYQRFALFIWFILPAMLAFVISFFIPLFSYFRFLFILPAYQIILASGINVINLPKVNKLLLAIFLTINFISFSVYFLNPKFHREDWKNATGDVVSSAVLDSVVLFEAPFVLPPFEIYSKNAVPAYGAIDQFTPNTGKVADLVSQYTSTKNQVFLFQYLSQLSDPNGLVIQELSKLGFQNIKTTNYNGVGFVYEFKKL